VSARSDLPTGVHVKLLGWIKSAVAFVRLPAGPQKTGPQPDAPREIDRRTVAHDLVPEPPVEIESRPETEIRDAPEIPASIAPEPEAGLESDSRAGESESAPDQAEINRRRSPVRGFFNDYWSSIDDKPASFAERLDGAEDYINERVAAGGESWRLSAATRKQLGLPPSRKK
jgi:hypothetical protein